MSDPPSKRRKTSPTTATSVDANPSAHRLQSPVTHRQSFQSPTRSSLARSNPEVLSHVLARSPTRSPQRRSSGNQELSFGLRERKALRPSLANAELSPLRQSPKRGSATVQAFAAPPRRVSRRIETPVRESSVALEVGLTTPVNNTTRESNPDEQLASELDSATRESEKRRFLAPSALPDDDYLEPDLPPTPTQLGREKISEAQQRLLRSSGIGQQKDSPGPSILGATEIASAADLHEELDDPDVRKRKNIKEDLLAQLDQLKTDVAQLEKWSERVNRGRDKPQPDQEAVASLISLLASTNGSGRPSDSSVQEYTPISTLISSLLPFSARDVPVETHSASPEPINAFALDHIADPKPWAAAFASLSLEHSRSLSISTGPDTSLTETHELTLSAPFPFPRDQFRIPLLFTTDLQSQRITSVSVPKDFAVSQPRIPQNLQAWIKSRTSSPILALDVSGLCVGISRFWEASVCRAKIWSRLRKSQEILLAKKGQTKLGDLRTEHLTGPLKKSDLRSIVPHLQRSSMLFSSSSSLSTKHSSSSSSSGGSSSSRRETKFLLSCELSLDQWTSEAQLKPDISISISDLPESKRNRIELDLKKLFHNVLREEGRYKTDSSAGMNEEREAQAIVKAAEGVMGVLFGLDIL